MIELLLDLRDRFLRKARNRRQFARMITAAFNALGTAFVSHDEESFSLAMAAGGTVYLENVYANYTSAAGKDRKRIVDYFIRGMSEHETIPSFFVDAAPRLLPVLRTASHHAAIGLTLQAKGEQNLAVRTAPLTGGIEVNLAYDTERAIKHVSARDFDAWHVAFDEALAVAVGNLRDRTDPTAFVEISPGLFKGNWNDSYESSRILLPDIFHRLSLRGDPVAFLPGRDHLWVAGSRDQDALAVVLEIAGESLFKPYALSEQLLVLDNLQWSVYEPEPGPARDALTGLQRRRIAVDYQQQKEDMEALFRRDGLDIFVATYFLTSKEGSNATFTWCSWAHGVDTLLPLTENIILQPEEEGKSIRVSWETAQAVAGELMMLQPEWTPPRYRVKSFPSDDQLVALRANSVEL